MRRTEPKHKNLLLRPCQNDWCPCTLSWGHQNSTNCHRFDIPTRNRNPLLKDLCHHTSLECTHTSIQVYPALDFVHHTTCTWGSVRYTRTTAKVREDILV